MNATRGQLRRCVAALCLAASCAPVLSGCGGLPVLPWFTREDTSQTVVAEHQQQFLIDGDPEALDWLLKHSVESGMTVEEVNSALGDAGERIEHDGQYKNTGGLYQQSDKGYRWGPDRKGRSVTLFFREGRLVNFDPDDFTG
jgi:hypothetical protein